MGPLNPEPLRSLYSSNIAVHHNQQPSPIPTQQPESQFLKSSQPTKHASFLLNDDQPLPCDDIDSIFSISSSDDKRQPQCNHTNEESNDGVAGNGKSDYEDDGQLSGYETNDNDYGAAFDEDTYSILQQLNADIKDNMYSPKYSEAVNFRVGMYFSNFEVFKAELRKHCIKNSFTYTSIRFGRTRVVIRCVEGGCPWTLTAVLCRIGPYFVIRNVSDVEAHTCQRLASNPQCTAAWIAKQYQTKILENLEMSI